MSPFLLLALVVLGPMPATRVAGRRAPQIGRLPILAPLGPGTGDCRSSAAPPELRNEGIVRMTMLVLDGTPSRMLAVSTNLRGGIAMFSAFYSVPAGPRRREGEHVMALFAPSGSLRSGTRSYYTTGTPARLSEDRSAPLSPRDAVAALALAKAVLARCAR
jgi:hypothetical protein